MKLPYLEAHYRSVLKPLVAGRVIPFLGAGVNLCGRPAGETWGLNRYLPSGWELTKHLTEMYGYSKEDPRDQDPDLLRVSQYVAVMSGTGPLYEELRRLFLAEYPRTVVHKFLARLPGVMRSKQYPTGYPESAYPLVITTNYDDVLERALDEVQEPYDLIYYAAQGDDKGKFLHRPPGGEPRPIMRPNRYRIKHDGRECLLLEHRPVILKIHGAVDRTTGGRDSYVITEDDYIDYLTLPDLKTLLPLPLPEWLNRCHFLFLGYSLGDWNMRAFLRRLWKDSPLTWNSWAIEIKERQIEKTIWSKRNVAIVTANMEHYVADLDELLQTWPNAGTI